jgi:hypothetical protein
MDTSNCKKQPKKQEDVAKRKEVKDRKKQKVEIQAQTVLNLGMDQITKFVYYLDGPLGEGNVQKSNSELD